jgi:glucan-binding YG repeat protein/cell wall-associated NlpC family hydrolase
VFVLDGLSGVDAYDATLTGGADSGSYDSSNLPVPGADAPVSASNASSAAAVSSSDFLTADEISEAFLMPLANDGSTTFARLLVYAEQYLGVDYVWGGKNFARDGGFDCSGFAVWVMNAMAGTSINGDYTNAAALYSDYCTPVSRDAAQPGDLVFFTGTYGSNANYITHVGIYCGNGIMIDAGDPIGYHYIDLICREDGSKADILFGRVNGTNITTASTLSLNELGHVYASGQWYTGGALTTNVLVSVAGTKLVEGRDYTLTYENNVNVGQARVTVTGIGSYTGSLTTTFSIVDPTGAIDDGVYTLTNSGGSLVLDVYGGSTSAGQVVQLFAAHGGTNQQFRVTRLDDGYYAIRNVKSGLPLASSMYDVSLVDGVWVSQEEESSNLTREWMIYRNADGSYTVASALDSTLVMGVRNNTCASEAAVEMQTTSGIATQRWAFRNADASASGSTAAGSSSSATTPAGWVTTNGATYYYQNGAKVTGEQQIGGSWYYFDETTGAMKTGFVRLTGSYLVNGAKTVYYDASGKMLYGEQQIDGSWYYFDEGTGAMATGFVRLTGSYLAGGPKTVYYDAAGKMLYGEQQIDGSWYYFDEGSGAMSTGFVRLTGAYLAGGPKTVYYDASGRMLYGEQQIGGGWYYFDEGSGAMATGFKFLAGSYLVGGPKTVYYDAGGRMVYGSQWINGALYYFAYGSGALS